MLNYLQKLIPTTPGKSEALWPMLWLIGVLLVVNLGVAGVMIKINDPPEWLSYFLGTLTMLLVFVVGHTLGIHNYLVKYNIDALKDKNDCKDDDKT